MKKIILIFITFFIFSNVYASGYIVMDMDNKEVLYESNKDEKRLIASISKIMTCIIAIENGNLDDTVTVDEDVLKAIGSSIYLSVGEQIKLKDLLYGLMLRSGNDAALMIAKHISGSEESFANLMNDYAKKIGMNNTSFINASGLEYEGKGNISTSYDMALLTSYAYQNDTFKEIFKTKDYNCKSNIKSYSWHNKNKLLKYDYVTGGKTGYTIKAKRTLVSTGNINGMNIVIVTLNDPNDFDNHVIFYNKVRNNYIKLSILDKDNFELYDDSINLDNKIYIKNSYSYTIKKEDINKINIKYYLENKEYNNNDNIGKVLVYYNDKLIYNEDLYITVNKRKNWFQKIFG